MRLIRSFLTLLLLLVVVSATAQTEQVVVVKGKKCTIHTIADGDTLYSLAREYDVPLKGIVELNSGVNADSLALGQAIYIPYNTKAHKKGKVAKSDPNPFIEHTIAQGDTLYSIAKHYRVELDVILADNEGITPEALKIGDVIKIRKERVGKASIRDIEREKKRDKHSDEAVRGDEDDIFALDVFEDSYISVTNDDDLLASLNASESECDSLKLDTISPVTEVRVPEFKRFEKNEVINVALMLPMHRNDKPQSAFVDFYRGSLLALEDLRRKGYSINVKVYDTKFSPETTRQIVESKGFANVNLIIGPVYPNELAEVVPFAEEHNIPLVTPLSDINPDQLSSPVVFQMKADGKYHYEKYAELLDGSYEVNIIYGAAGNDESYLKDVLAATSHLNVRHLVASASGLKASFFVRKSDGTAGAAVPLQSLTPANGRSIVFIVANKDVVVQKILETIGEAVKKSPRGVNDCVVAGNHKWDNLKYMDFKGVFQCGVSTITAYNSKRIDNNAMKIFESRYLTSYGILPTPFSCRGYDAFMIFCTKMFTGLDKSILLERITPLATPYSFKFEDGMFINTEWVEIKYQRDFTITYE